MPSATKTRPARKPETDAEREAREAARAEKLAGMHAALAEGVERLVDSAEWKRMLTTAGRFHRYSWRNCMLIVRQMPEATQVASYRTWQSMGRQVRKGETGLAILAPITFKVDDENAPESEKGQRAVRGFRVESVFDISQTDGEELPDVAPQVLDGQVPEGFWDAIADQIHTAGFMLMREEPSRPGAFGEADFNAKTVRVKPDVPAAQASKTQVHELAHILMGHGPGSCADHRSQREVEAESVAYVVCQAVGVDTAAYSLAYVAEWAEEGKAVETVTQTADRVVKAAHEIIEALPDGLAA